MAPGDFFQRFIPENDGVPFIERLVSSLAAGMAVMLVIWMSSAWLDSSIYIVASVGASAILVFSLPASPVSQPWSVVGGYLVCAAAGVVAAKSGLDLRLAGALAVGLGCLGMLFLRCLHPPGGAVALYAVVGGEKVHALGYQYVLMPCVTNAVMLVAVALIVNNLLPRRHYPRRPPSPHVHASGLEAGDIAAALKEYGQSISSSEEEIDALIDLAEQHAEKRRKPS